MIQVLNKAINIIEFLAADPSREYGLSEIADPMNLNHGTCANILKTLVQRNYVEQPTAKKGYKLGYMVYKLTNSNIYNEELTNLARENIDQLSRKLNEAVILSVIKHDKRIVLYRTMPSQELTVRTSIELSVYRATTGRMIISHYTDEEIERLVDRIGLPNGNEWPEVKSLKTLKQKLEVIRKNEMEIYTNNNHIVGLATPIFKGDEVIASLGIYLPSTRYLPSKRRNLIAAIKKTTNQINEKIKQQS